MATPPLPPPSSPRPANDPEKAPAATAAAPPENDVTAELDADEVARGWRAIDDAREGRQRRQPRKHALVCWGARSDIGRVRENNEDKFDFFLPDDPHTLAARGRLWAVADGMGGHNAGQIASEAALKAVVRAYYGGDAEEGIARGDDGAAAAAEEPGERLRAALEGANALIHQAASRVGDNRGMGTTATVAVVRDDQLTVGHVGDSRAYLLRAGVLRQLTDDHSWVEEQVRRGGMSREQAEASPYRNVITRSIGMGASIEIDIVREPLQAGDVVLLCSDGLTGYLDGQSLAGRLAGAAANPSKAALALVDAANDAGGRDNVTVLILAVRDVGPYPDASSPAG